MQIQSFINIKQNTKADFFFGLIVINILTLGFLFGFLSPGDIDTDGGIFSAVAFKEINGGTLYQDAWENKPPGIIYLMEFFFRLIPDKVYALYGLAIFGALGISNGLFFVTFKFSQSLLFSSLTLALFILFTFNNNTIGDVLYTEIYGSIFIVWGLYAARLFETTTKVKFAHLAAFIAGFSFWFKEPFVLLALPILIQLSFKLKRINLIIKTLGYFSIPSFLFCLILWLNNSFGGFMKMIKYNFIYSDAEAHVTNAEQLSTLWINILNPLFIPSIIIIINTFRCWKKKELQLPVFSCLLLLLGAVAFILISPYNFNHYYIPFIVVFFYCFSALFQYEKSVYNGSPIFIYILVFYSIYKMDNENEHPFKLSISTYKEDNITKTLTQAKGKTLFIDLVDASGYYIKGDKLYPTFMPVPIAAHFTESKEGLINRKRIFEELNGHKPDFLITTESSSYMYWHVPDPLLYYGNYEKIDSTMAKYGKNVILWKLKQH